MRVQLISISVDDESLEGARSQIRSRIPAGLRLLSENILSDGSPQTARGLGTTPDEALVKALHDVLTGAQILEQKQIRAAAKHVVRVDAFDEAGASVAAKAKHPDGVIKTVTKAVEGKSGFLGLGKKPHQYDVEVFEPAAAEVVHKTKARVAAEIGNGLILSCRNCSTTYKVGHDAVAAPMAVVNRRMGKPPGPLDDTHDLVFHFSVTLEADPSFWEASDKFLQLRLAEMEASRSRGGIDIRWICQSCIGRGAGSSAANRYPVS